MTTDSERSRGLARVVWHLGALAAFALAAVLTMRPWLDPGLLPGADFPGFAAEVDWTRARLERDGTLPSWVPERFGGATRFMSNLKEVLTYPLASQLGAVQGTKAMFVLMRIAAAFGMYLLCARWLGSPLAGLAAGYAYGFGAPANLQATLGGHLDLAISSALFPMILLAAAALLRHRRVRDAVLLGTLVAVEFCAHSYLQAMIVPVIFLLLLLLRPWRHDPRADDPRAEPALARRWLGLTAGALAVFLLLGASQAAWLAADLPNHMLHTPETVEHGLRTYVEHSPFLWVNRDDWLGGWLRDHRPPGLELSPNPLFNQHRYLGLVALALVVAGWGFARSDFGLRRWFQTFLLLFAFQYWMSIGPQTLVWQMARSFHWPTSADGPVRALLTAGAVACLVWAAVLFRRRRRDPAVSFARIELTLGLALAQTMAAHSIFAVLYAAVPVLRGMRSPGHFFDLAPFAFYAMLGVAVAAGLRRVAPGVRPALVAAVVAALAVDFLPSLAGFRLRRDAEALETMRGAVGGLPGEHGTLRIAIFPAYAPPGASLVTAVADAGTAWTWLYWQAGRHWQPYLAAATAWLSPDMRDPNLRPLARRIGNSLVRSGRLAYLLEEFGGFPRLLVEPPWARVTERGPFALWQGPPVLPMGTVFGSFALLVGGTTWDQAVSVADAFEHGVVTVSGGDRLADSGADTVGAAGAIRALGASLDDPASRALATRHADAVLTLFDATAAPRWEGFLRGAAARPPTAAEYARPAPDRMVFDVTPRAEAAVLFVSEAHHPWWRARVDGAPADVLRAQLAFMAVRLPAGARRVELELHPPALVVAADRLTQGTWLALAVAAVIAAGLALRRRAAR